MISDPWINLFQILCCNILVFAAPGPAFLAKSDGKDKLLATLQYAAMFVSAGSAGTGCPSSQRRSGRRPAERRARRLLNNPSRPRRCRQGAANTEEPGLRPQALPHPQGAAPTALRAPRAVLPSARPPSLCPAPAPASFAANTVSPTHPSHHSQRRACCRCSSRRRR